MNTIRSFMRSISKRTYAGIAVAVAAVAIPAGLYAWGPANRVTFTMAKPADYVTFNSITDNQTYGDERNFVQVRNLTDNTQYGDNTSLIPGKEYEVRAYYHNNASTSLNDAAHNYAGIATGAFMRTEMPATVAAGANARITSYVGATNAKHLDAAGTNLGNQVWDEAFGKNSTNAAIALNYIAGSAKVSSNGAVNGQSLADSIFTTGAPLGYSALDGKIPGCLQYSGYVTYRFKVNQPNFTVSKMVRAENATDYSETITAKAGDTVVYRIEYKNTGTTTQNNVVIRDQLPAGMTYVPGSTYLASSASNGQYVQQTAETVTQQGINIGNYLPGGNAFVKFSAKVTSQDKLACGMNTLTNTGAADTANGSKSDTAVVTVNKTCTTPTPVYTCDSLTVDKISRTEFKFTVAKTVENATYIKTVFVIKNAAGTVVATVDDADGVYNYTQTNPGTYTVAATIHVTVSGVAKTATSTACAKTFTVNEEPVVTHPAVDVNKTVNGKETTEVKVNEQFVYEIVVKNTGDIDLKGVKATDTAPTGITFVSADIGTVANNTWAAAVDLKVGESKSYKITAVAKAYVAGATVNKVCVDATEVTGNPDDCDTASTTMPKPVEPTIEVCDLATDTIVTIKEKDFDAAKHSKDLAKCDKIKVCELSSKHVITIATNDFDSTKHSKNLVDCKPVEEEKCTVPGKETMPADSPDCKNDAVTPAELPHTGITDGLVSVLGAGSLVGMAGAFAASRRALKQN
ncbi:MAG: DUF11 domain-containing protein [Candidatus Saccharimonas sp.]|nr:DUF11 domain-containing protein [Candidatus Saccharimonas sp.]